MFITLSISATSLKLLSVKGGKVDNWGQVPLAPGLVRDGLILQPEAVGAAIDTLFKSLKVPRREVITSLTGLTFTHRILTLPRMKSALLEEAVPRAARKEMPLPPEKLYLTWQVIERRDDELDLFILGVPRNLVDAATQTLDAAGVRSDIMDLRPLALARAAYRREAIIADLEPDCFDIVLIAGGIPAIMHTITPRGKEASLEDNVQRLTDELTKTIAYYNNSHPEEPLNPKTPLLLTGELAAEAAELIRSVTVYPVKPLIPPLKLPEDLPVAPYAANIGLALKKLPIKAAAREAPHFRDINLNLLSAKYRARTQPLPRRNILAPVAFVLAIGLLFPLYYIKSQADALTARQQTELTTANQEVRAVRLADNRAKEIEATISEKQANADSWQQEQQYLLSRGRGSTDNLKLVTRALPPGAYFTGIEIASRQVIVEGKADTAFTVVEYVTALEKAEIFAEVRIAEITDGTRAESTAAETTRVSFSIVITRQD